MVPKQSLSRATSHKRWRHAPPLVTPCRNYPIPSRTPSSSWGGMHRGWEHSSPKDNNIAALPYKSRAGHMLPTFSPRQQPLQASCIDHRTRWDIRRISRQTEDIMTAQTAFLDYQGVMGTLNLPIPLPEALSPPLARPPRVPLFRYPIPEPTLDG